LLPCQGITGKGGVGEKKVDVGGEGNARTKRSPKKVVFRRSEGGPPGKSKTRRGGVCVLLAGKTGRDLDTRVEKTKSCGEWMMVIGSRLGEDNGGYLPGKPG